MNYSIRNLIASCIFILIGGNTFSQHAGKKYIKRNRDATTIDYGDSLIYARGLYNDSTRIFIGNSDGSIYYLNLEKKNSQLIFKMKHVDEIRDIEKCDDYIIAMHSGDDGKLIFVNLDGTMNILSLPMWQGVFLDGMDFIGKRGFMMGDPTNGNFNLFHTSDGGKKWAKCTATVPALTGEAGFAASGTNVQILNDSTYIFVSGGMQSRFFKSTDNGASWKNVVLPYYPGESTGAYSVCFSNESEGVIVGGDYKDADISLNTSFYTSDGGASWFNAMKPVRGYRSCVYNTNGVFYACGRNGIDFSIDGGKEWIPFANGSFFSLSSTKDNLIATTSHGKIILFDLIEFEK